jgi:hypothetical protein
VKPLTKLTKKKEGEPFVWTKEAEEALNTLIDIVTSNLVLKCPNLER